MRHAILAGTVLAVLAASPAAAAGGAPDRSFGRGGYVTGAISEDDAATSLVRLADGRVVVAGYASGRRDPTSFFLTRYLPNGGVDGSFGTRGVVRTAFGRYSAASDLLALPDGRLVAVGFSDQGVALARYSASGRIDPSFGRGGRVVAPVGGPSTLATLVADAALLPDGGIAVVGGLVTGQLTLTPFVMRFLADGRPDPAFGTSGYVLPTFATGQQAYASGVAATPEGLVVVTGLTTAAGSGVVPFLVRYLPNGVMDPVFGSTAMRDMPGALFTSLVRTPEGFFLTGGSRSTRGADGGERAAVVTRFLPTGHLDVTFGEAGVAWTRSGAHAQVDDVALTPDGGIVAVGHVARRTSDTLLVRLTSGGAPDASFGTRGVAVAGPATLHDGAVAVVVAPDGRITTTGSASDGRGAGHALTARFTA